MPAGVNLDALIPREDFDAKTAGEESPIKQTIEIKDLERTAFFYGALRKPDFQRETEEWSAERVFGLIQTFINGDLIPAIILWRNKELLFVIDGSHRLSALTAWVHDDYGDGPLSLQFFDNTIPDEQLKLAKRTRMLVEKQIGSYKDHKAAVADPTVYGHDIVTRARRLATLSLELQWVRGNAAQAEESFQRINQQSAKITPQELELLQSRRKPNTIAARAIIRRGTGHQYWAVFESRIRGTIQEIAIELHKLLFEPKLNYPIKSLDLPAGGGVYSGTSLRMVYDFVALSNGVQSPEDDATGERTVACLNRCRRAMKMLLSNDPSSLGLHPAVYFYSWTGKQQPILFLTIASLMVDWERDHKLGDFLECRGRLERFLLDNRPLLNQVIRKFGTKDSGTKHVRGFYEDVIRLLQAGVSAAEVPQQLKSKSSYSYLQPAEVPYDGVTPTKFSAQVRSGITIKELMKTAPQCPICLGLVPTQAISIDHITRKQDGGPSTIANAQMTHPYCNTGHKEKRAHSQRVKSS